MVNTDTAFLAPLSCTDNSTSEQGFVIRRNSASQGMEIVDTVGADVTTYTDTVLIFGEDVDYTVVAFDGFGESDPSNAAIYSMPATFQPLSLSYVCYSSGVDSLTWTVTNPNAQVLPFIYAQFWSPQRDALFAPVGTSMFLTANNPQDPNTSGDDNITGIYYAVENGNSQEDVVFSGIDLTISCGSIRRPELPWATQAYFMPWVEINQSTTSLQETIDREALQVMPNPFQDQLTLRLGEWQGEGTLRLLDATGRIVLSETLDLTRNHTLELEDLPSGIYLLELGAQEMILSRKVVKQ